jgi:preprotein translocase subunit SecF
MQILSKTNFNFIKWRWHAIALSALVILAGAAVIVSRGGLPLGIDFSGGTDVIVKFEQPTSEDEVRRALDRVAAEKMVQQYGDPSAHEVLIRLPQSGEATSLDQDSKQVVDALHAGLRTKFEIISTEIVGPVVGAELRRKGIYATIASILAITAYLGFRFRFSFAVGALAATFHDILVTLAFLAFFKYDLSLNVVAAILTITGYSVNDTIVIFDRVRENQRTRRREPLESVVNASVNQTLGRTIITAGATFLTVLALYLFGGEVLHGFAFTMLVGIVSGTYSTVFIAAAIAIVLSRRSPARSGSAPVRAESTR